MIAALVISSQYLRNVAIPKRLPGIGGCVRLLLPSQYTTPTALLQVPHQRDTSTSTVGGPINAVLCCCNRMRCFEMFPVVISIVVVTFAASIATTNPLEHCR